jgi:hypothetical protein
VVVVVVEMVVVEVEQLEEAFTVTGTETVVVPD